MRSPVPALLLVCFLGLSTNQSHAANITWASAVTDPAGADAAFVTLLQNAGHSVTRFNVAAALTPADVTLLNSADLIIASRAVASGNFDNAAGEIWNEQITKPVIAMSAYITRNNRMGWATGSGVPDSGPTPLVAANPAHPIFAGITFAGNGVTMANNYNVMIDRGTTQMGESPLNGTIIATNPLFPNSVAIAEWAAGATVMDEVVGAQTLAGPRYFFAGGSREPNGGAVTAAGVMDLTADGQQLFLNTVNYALIPEPATWLLALLGLSLLAYFKRR
jgi:PEP-CTERM motif